MVVVPKEVRTFQLDPVFMARPSEESDAAWEALGGRKSADMLYLMYTLHAELWPADGPHQGFVLLDDDTYSGGEPGKKYYGVSVFHQLHCLVRRTANLCAGMPLLT